MQLHPKNAENWIANQYLKIADEKEGLKDESFPGFVYRGIKEVKRPSYSVLERLFSLGQLKEAR